MGEIYLFKLYKRSRVRFIENTFLLIRNIVLGRSSWCLDCGSNVSEQQLVVKRFQVCKMQDSTKSFLIRDLLGDLINRQQDHEGG